MQIGSSRLLFDSGPGTMRRLLEAGTSIFDISHIFYSHFHPDHTSEFVPFIFATKYPDGSRRKIPLTVGGGRGFLPDLLNTIEFDNKKSDHRQLENFTVETAPVAHNEESIAYRVTSADGSSAVYTGDTDHSETIIDLAKKTDLLICECALPDKLRVPGHLTPSLAGDLAARAEVRKLVLTHFYPECEKEDIEAECRKTYDGPLVLAEDLMEITVG
jgi:ribonuclease BN (tRNA processing enzyme)